MLLEHHNANKSIIKNRIYIKKEKVMIILSGM